MPKKSHAEAQRRHRVKLRERALDLVGRKCVFCGSCEKVEMAHLAVNGIRGPGRGWERRYGDVVKNPKDYAPMCVEHHRLFDRLTARLREQAAREKEEKIPF